MNISLTGLLPDEITALLSGKQEKYRGIQIFRWIHEHNVESFDEMTNLSKPFREEIAQLYTIGALTLSEVCRSVDGSTEKFLWKLVDGLSIEGVILRDGDRVTACISSQVGCRMGCAFCRTGEMGFRRNLTSGEIVDQLIHMRRYLSSTDEDITNIVFMGMGEPLDNMKHLLKALGIINMETTLGISQRKITVSTSGLVPEMKRLSDEFPRIGIAISLNATDDELRARIMPVNNRYQLADILDASLEYTRSSKRRITFEYILMAGVNDSPAQALKLLAIVRKIPSKVNLIGYNEYEGAPYRRPSSEVIEAFQKILIDGGVTAIIRKSKGDDILAACGQLAGKSEE
ncbi:23S rRNA (adenine(2503)-C(2))-methyltransferase RlmN [Candidatus Latescibacterota bacterium]